MYVYLYIYYIILVHIFIFTCTYIRYIFLSHSHHQMYVLFLVFPFCILQYTCVSCEISQSRLLDLTSTQKSSRFTCTHAKTLFLSEIQRGTFSFRDHFSACYRFLLVPNIKSHLHVRSFLIYFSGAHASTGYFCVVFLVVLGVRIIVFLQFYLILAGWVLSPFRVRLIGVFMVRTHRPYFSILVLPGRIKVSIFALQLPTT